MQQRHEHFVERHTQDRRLVRWLAGVGAVIDRIAAHADALNGENREAVLFVVVAGVIAKGPLQRGFTGLDRAFEHDFGAGWHLQFGADALHQLGPRATQQSCELILGQRVRHRRHRAQDRCWIGAQRDRDRERFIRLEPGNDRGSRARRLDAEASA